MIRHSRLWLVILFVCAVSSRLFVGAWQGLSAPPESGSDAQEYDCYAWNVAQGRGYRGLSPDVTDNDHFTAYRPPGPSLIWAGLFTFFGHRYDVIRAFHCVLGAASAVLLFQIARYCFSTPTAWLAAWGWAFWPVSLLYSSQLLSEPIAGFVLLLFVLAALRFAQGPSWHRAVLVAFILGCNLLVHPSKLFVLPFLGIWAVWQFRKHPRHAIQAIAIPALSLLVLAPWAARNYVVFDKFIPFSTMGGSVLLQGNNRVVVTDPVLFGYSVWDTKIPEYRELLQAPNDEVKRDEVARQLAVEWLLNNRDKWPFLIQAKLRRGFTPLLQSHSPRLYRLGTLFSWGPVLVLFAAAFIPTLMHFLRTGHPGWIIHLVILHYVAIIVIFFGYSRYRYPIEPLCVLLAAAAVTFLSTRLQGKRSTDVSSEAVRPE